MAWKPMEDAPLDGTCVMLAFDGETAPGYYDDGTDCNGEPCEEPCWCWFDNIDTGPIDAPVAWQPYPEFPREKLA
jgi:hypothetical protein